SRRTFMLTNPMGKELPIGSLECAELGMAMRVLFASWYGLPFYLEARDGNGKRLYAGHFGFRTAEGRYRNTPEFKVRYNDYSHLSNADALASWPRDNSLRSRHLYGGGSDNNGFLGEDAGAGYYFDEILLNKRVGYFLTVLLPYFGSINLGDDSNAYHVQPEGVRGGDILLKRWQKRGIGHVMVVKQVDEVASNRLSVTIVSGSMPRRQGVWESPASSKMAFTSDYTGGEGTNRDGDSYVNLGGGLKRFLAPQKHHGKWRQRVIPADIGEYIQWSDRSTRAARPARFDQLLGEPDPETLRDELLQIIEAKRAHLRNYPASCSARIAREQAFEALYELMDEKFDMNRDEVDSEYRVLDDYVFAELVYNQSKTCCWNSTTADMYEIIMDFAEAEAQQTPCKTPTVFMNTNGGYSTWSQHADSMGRPGDWVAWSADESCPQSNTLNDVEEVHGWTPWCEITSDDPNPPDPQPGTDPFEANNSHEQAYPLEAGTYEGAAITAGDEDWFTFTPPTGALVRVRITFENSAGDLDLELYRTSWPFPGPGDVVDSSTNRNEGEESVDTTYDGVEQIYARVFGYHEATNTYRIEVEFEGGLDLGPACSTEDDTMETAPTVDIYGTFNELGICSNDTVDWYRISATVGAGPISIEFSHTQGDLDMELYRSNGDLIDSSNSTTDNEMIDSPSGVRYVKVFGYSGATAGYSLVISND
ncbi:MAG: PPC domain-containing protein, partial [Myxococcota bacterium]|nr:PPC domain-containing protein [Myxococcota bacterium]